MSSEPLFAPDVILRSSDLVDFPTHKVSLASAFEVFEDMFKGGSSTGEEQDMENGLPVIPMNESSHTIGNILCLLYIRSPPDLSRLQSLRDICKALDKYIVKKFPYIVENALGCQYRLSGVMEAAARASLNNPTPINSRTLSSKYLASISHAQRDAYSDYQEKCLAIAIGPTIRLDWIREGRSGVPGMSKSGGRPNQCSCHRSNFPGPANSNYLVPKWILDYLYNVRMGLKRNMEERVSLDVELCYRAALDALACEYCRLQAKQLYEFAEALFLEIERRIASVTVAEIIESYRDQLSDDEAHVSSNDQEPLAIEVDEDVLDWST